MSQASVDKELQVSLGLEPSTIARGADGAVTVDETLVEIDASGHQLAKVQESAKFDWTPGQAAASYTNRIELHDGAATLHVVVRDKGSGHVGSLTMPLAGLNKTAP